MVLSAIADPQKYEAYHRKFNTDGLPVDAQGWLERAKDVSNIFADDAAQRDISNTSPVLEVSLLKSSGLLKVLGPVTYGGGGQSWEVGYKVIREVAKGDGWANI